MLSSTIPFRQLENTIYFLNQNGYSVQKSQQHENGNITIYYRKNSKILFTPVQEAEFASVSAKRQITKQTDTKVSLLKRTLSTLFRL